MDVSVDTRELQLSDFRWAPSAPAESGRSGYLPHHLILFLPIEEKQKAGEHGARAGCCLFLCPFLFLFCPPQQEYVSLPLHPSATCGNLSVTSPALVLLLLAWATHWKRQNIYPGVSEPVGRFSLILAIKLGVGRHATVQLAPTLVRASGQG